MTRVTDDRSTELPRAERIRAETEAATGQDHERAARGLRARSYACQACGHVFDQTDTILRGTRGEVFCEACSKPRSLWWQQFSTSDPEPCATCGILVVYATYNWEHHRTRVACSTVCRDRARLAARRVEPTTRTCAACDREFTPSRRDARYCSNACRQRAYRDRQLAGGEPG